jgi:hypothetical protein
MNQLTLIVFIFAFGALNAVKQAVCASGLALKSQAPPAELAIVA